MAEAPQLSYYDLLDLTPSATRSEIKAAFRRIAKSDHPDINGGRQSPRFVAAQEAYTVLVDEASRRDYDESLGSWSAATGDENQDSESDESDHSAGAGSSTRTYRGSIEYPTSLPSYSPPLLHNHDGAAPVAATTRLRQLWQVLFVPLVLSGAILAGISAQGAALDWLGEDVELANGLAFIIILAACLGLVPFVAFKAFTRVWPFRTTLGLIAATIMCEITPGIPLGVRIGLILVWVGLLGAHKGLPLRSKHERRPIAAEDTAVFPIFGRPGTGLIDEFGHNGELGSIGEHRSAQRLQELAQFPGAKIFHSLKFAPDSQADVDHAVMYGRSIALIDSKMWAPGHATVANQPGSPEVALRLNDGRVDYRVVRMNEAVEKYETLFPKHTIRPWVILHSTGPAHTWDNSPHNEMHLGDADSVITDIAEWFAAENPTVPTVDRWSMATFFSLLKS